MLELISMIFIDAENQERFEVKFSGFNEIEGGAVEALASMISDDRAIEFPIIGQGRLQCFDLFRHYIRNEFDRIGGDYRCNGTPVYIAFPRPLPLYYGKDVCNEVEDYLQSIFDREEAKLTKKRLSKESE